MNPKTYEFAIIGGDLRQIYMANELIKEGFTVIVYGLNNPILDLTCPHADSMAEAIDSSQVIITPIPVSKDKLTINSLNPKADLTIRELCTYLNRNHKLYGGCLTTEITSFCDTIKIPYTDFMEQEEITLFNTIATAEGTIAEAILSSTTNLHKSSCLILGYGRCAKTIGEKLKGLCGHIDVAARSAIALADADTASYGTLSLTDLNKRISEYDYIFNTIPSLVLTKDLLVKTNPQVVIIDIASNPGGVDFNAAKELGRSAKLCLGLPGKYSPKSSATFLTDYLLTHLGKK